MKLVLNDMMYLVEDHLDLLEIVAGEIPDIDNLIALDLDRGRTAAGNGPYLAEETRSRLLTIDQPWVSPTISGRQPGRIPRRIGREGGHPYAEVLLVSRNREKSPLLQFGGFRLVESRVQVEDRNLFRSQQRRKRRRRSG